MAEIWIYDIEIEEIAIIAFFASYYLLGLVFWLARRKGKSKDLNAALKHHQDALETDREIGYKQGEANQMGNIGNVYFEKGDLNTARDYYKVALKIDREIGHREGEAIDLGNIGNVYFAKGDLETALEYYEDALKIAKEIGHREGEATALKNIATVYREMGNVHKAQEYQGEADKMKREKGMLEQLAGSSLWDWPYIAWRDRKARKDEPR